MDPNQERFKTIVKWIGGLVGAVLISPFVFLAVKGIVGLAIACAIGFTTIQLAPVAATKITTWKFKLIAADAKANPIETMESIYLEKVKELREKDQNIVEFETAVGQYDDKLTGFKKRYPAEAEKFQAVSTKMHEGLSQVKDRQREARVQLVAASQEIEKAKAIWDMSLAAQQVTRFSKSAEQEVFQKIRQETALDSVQASLNRSFANLNLAIDQQQGLLAEGGQA